MINPIQVFVCEDSGNGSINHVSNAARAYEKNRWAYDFQLERIVRLEVEQCD